ncbi:MAG: TM2 domain-containing protein [Deltaproteobacteria bacterium]|nr:TM2 domain-containing protein [Deltaproteobacteria bacterium]
MSTVSLLGMFFGMFGLHRFYMGKNVSGIFMILTLGGLGMWSIIDVIWSFAGKFHDKNGLPINVSRPIDTGIILIPIIIMAIMYSFYIIAVIAMIIATDNY